MGAPSILQGRVLLFTGIQTGLTAIKSSALNISIRLVGRVAQLPDAALKFMHRCYVINLIHQSGQVLLFAYNHIVKIKKNRDPVVLQYCRRSPDSNVHRADVRPSQSWRLQDSDQVRPRTGAWQTPAKLFRGRSSLIKLTMQAHQSVLCGPIFYSRIPECPCWRARVRSLNL